MVRWIILTLLVASAPVTAEPKEQVAGIGGLFFRAEAPAELAQWYKDHLGISLVPKSYDVEPWKQETGPTVFAPSALV